MNEDKGQHLYKPIIGFNGGIIFRSNKGRFISKKNKKKPSSRKPTGLVKKDRLGDDGNIPKFFTPGVRLVDLNLLAVKLWCQYCDEPLSLRNCLEDKRNVFKSELKIKCLKCAQIRSVLLSWIDEQGNTGFYESQGPASRRSMTTLLSRTCKKANVIIAKNAKRQTESITCETKRKAVKAIRPFAKTKTEPVKIDLSSVNLSKSRVKKTESEIPDDVDLKGIAGTEETFASTSGANQAEDETMNIQDMEWENDAKSDSEDEEVDYKPPIKKLPKIFTETTVTKADGPNFLWISNSQDSEGESCTSVNEEKCHYCDELFSTYMKARIHMSKRHEEFHRKVCGLCGDSFESSPMNTFNRHLKKHRMENNTICEVCGDSVMKVELKRHMIKHLPKAFPCPICSNKSFKSDGQMQRHVLNVHGPSMTCDFCGKSFTNRDRIIEHVRYHLFNKKWTCEHCPAEFERKDNMMTHMRNNHSFICLVCSANFTMAALVKQHVETDHTQHEISALGLDGDLFERVTRFRCEFCLRHLASKQSLDFHISRTHKSTEATLDHHGDSAQSN